MALRLFDGLLGSASALHLKPKGYTFTHHWTNIGINVP